MYTEIFLGIALLVFVILAYFIIHTLLKFQRTLCQATTLLESIKLKLNTTDSLLHSLSNLGDICEQKTALLKTQCLQESAPPPELHESLGDAIVDWVFLTTVISKKLLNRR